jgi:hypothetical protein
VLMLTVAQSERFAPYRLWLPVEIETVRGRKITTKVQIPAARVATVPVPGTLDGAPKSVTFDRELSVLGTVVVK